MDNKFKVKRPTLMTNKRLIYLLYHEIINQTIQFIIEYFKLDNDLKLKLNNYMSSQEIYDKIICIDMPKEIRNSLINN